MGGKNFSEKLMGGSMPISVVPLFTADERSRVILPELDEDALSTYINANYIRVRVF